MEEALAAGRLRPVLPYSVMLSVEGKPGATNPIDAHGWELLHFFQPLF